MDAIKYSRLIFHATSSIFHLFSYYMILFLAKEALFVLQNCVLILEFFCCFIHWLGASFDLCHIHFVYCTRQNRSGQKKIFLKAPGD